MNSFVRSQAIADKTGDDRLVVRVGTHDLEVFTYHPKAKSLKGLVVVFHGVLRNAETYRDHSRQLADQAGVVVAAPCFDQTRFPTSRYQQGGIVDAGVSQPAANWTFSLIPELIRTLQSQIVDKDVPVYLLGHSGGGQFLARMAGFVNVPVRRIIAANPGTHLFLNREHRYPFGFGGLPDDISNDVALQRYLTQPLTLYLGTGDTQRDDNLDQSSDADRQGLNRYERGRRAFARAQQLARANAWQFGWKLVEARDVPHDHERMFNHPQCTKALFDEAT